MPVMLRVLKHDPRASQLCTSMRELANLLISQIPKGPKKQNWIELFLSKYNGRNGQVEVDQFACYILRDEMLPHLDTEKAHFCRHILQVLATPPGRVDETIVSELLERSNKKAEDEHKSSSHAWWCLYHACRLDTPDRASIMVINAWSFRATLTFRSAGDRVQQVHPDQFTPDMMTELKRLGQKAKDGLLSRCRDKLIALAAESSA
jgi:hypothetical protein